MRGAGRQTPLHRKREANWTKFSHRSFFSSSTPFYPLTRKFKVVLAFILRNINLVEEVSCLKYNTKTEKRGKVRREEEKKKKMGGRGEEESAHISPAWRFAEVCTPLEPAVPSLMIPVERLWGTASVARLAFTFPAPGILGYASGGLAHHSKSSSGSLLLLSPNRPFFLLLYFCIRTQSLSLSSSFGFRWFQVKK